MDFDIYKLVDKYKLSHTEQEILQYILDHSEEAVDLNVRKIAKLNYTSSATVVRLAQKLGYKGYTDMAYRINFAIKSEVERISSSSKSKSIINIDYLLKSVTQEETQTFINLMNGNSGIIYVNGVGFSQPIAQYITRKLLVLGYKAVYTDSFELYENNRQGSNLAILVSRTGETCDVAKIAKLAVSSRISVISFTGSHKNTIAQNSAVNFKIHDDDKFDDRNINSNYFYSNVIALFEYLISQLQ